VSDPAVAEPAVVVCREVVRTYRVDAFGTHPDAGNGTVHALRGVSLELARGTFTALVGPSGSGKSTLLRLLACVDRADDGLVRVDGVDVTRLSRGGRVRLRRRRLGLVAQNPADNLLEYLTVREHLRLAARLRGIRASTPQVDELLDRLGLTDRGNHLPRQLSGGEQQRVALAFAALGPPALLVADEPTGQLDRHAVDEVLDAIDILTATGVAIVAATHDLAVARRAHQVIHLRDGRVEEALQWT
jgi:ABC-type lipoprotein export system ATPase subunit